MDHKKSTADALNKFFKKEHKKTQSTSGKKTVSKPRKYPEKDVVKQLCAWLKENGFSYNIIEASTYNRQTGRNHDSKVSAGFPDIVASDRFGFACYIEAKAPKKRKSGIQPHQYEFLKTKINNNAFACCTDSVEHLHNLYHQWIVLKLKVRELQVLRPVTMSQAGNKSPNKLLLDDLPVPKLLRDKNTDPVLGF